jgi:hypothetical protein
MLSLAPGSLVTSVRSGKTGNQLKKERKKKERKEGRKNDINK